jgi:7SK snRNA methylphosphate capping enzyme
MDPTWFREKCCLDIGCNVGRVTYAIARDFQPARIVGIDIDGHLISVARKNIRQYLKGDEVPGSSDGRAKDFGYFKPDGKFKGPPTGDEKFPENVGFVSVSILLLTLVELPSATQPAYLALHKTLHIIQNF